MAEVIHQPSPERDRITLAAEQLQGLEVKVGWFAGNMYPAVGKRSEVPVAYVAAIQEFGYPEGGIPPRLGMRSTIDAKVNEWRELVRKGVAGIPSGKRTAAQVMEALGATVAGDFRKTIAEVESPPLSERTIYNRQHRKEPAPTTSVKPLSDQRILMQTLTHQVENNS